MRREPKHLRLRTRFLHVNVKCKQKILWPSNGFIDLKLDFVRLVIRTYTAISKTIWISQLPLNRFRADILQDECFPRFLINSANTRTTFKISQTIYTKRTVDFSKFVKCNSNWFLGKLLVPRLWPCCPAYTVFLSKLTNEWIFCNLQQSVVVTASSIM